RRERAVAAARPPRVPGGRGPPASGHRAGGGRGRTPLAVLEQRRVVGLDVLARLDGRAQPDLPGDLAADALGRAAGPCLVVLVDLQLVVIVVVAGRPGVAEDLA